MTQNVNVNSQMDVEMCSSCINEKSIDDQIKGVFENKKLIGQIKEVIENEKKLFFSRSDQINKRFHEMLNELRCKLHNVVQKFNIEFVFIRMEISQKDKDNYLLTPYNYVTGKKTKTKSVAKWFCTAKSKWLIPIVKQYFVHFSNYCQNIVKHIPMEELKDTLRNYILISLINECLFKNNFNSPNKHGNGGPILMRGIFLTRANDPQSFIHLLENLFNPFQEYRTHNDTNELTWKKKRKSWIEMAEKVIQNLQHKIFNLVNCQHFINVNNFNGKNDDNKNHSNSNGREKRDRVVINKQIEHGIHNKENQKMLALENENDALVQEKERYRLQCQMLADVNQNVSNENQNLRNENQNLRNENQNLRNEYQNLRNEKIKLEMTNRELMLRLSGTQPPYFNPQIDPNVHFSSNNTFCDSTNPSVTYSCNGDCNQCCCCSNVSNNLSCEMDWNVCNDSIGNCSNNTYPQMPSTYNPK